jgi:tetratricopeptide (TPR) repeat protein
MSPFAGIGGIGVLRLSNMPVNGEYWLAYSKGTRSTAPSQQHFVAAFERAQDGWREVSRLTLQHPDYMSENSVMQTDIEPSHAWLTIDSGSGAHGGCFDLISFDGKDLRNEVSGCSSSPAAGAIEDLDGDGKGEVVLNATDHYVFCYACGVRRINYTVLRWDGENLVTVQAADLPADAPADLKASNDRAVELFNHELMKDALAKIEEAAALDPSNATVKWNDLIIKLHADARRDHVRESGYPLLTNIFYGDYAAALDVLREYPIDQVMQRAGQSPLIVGTPAEDNVDYLVSNITGTTSLALEAQPDLAAAYFLRGWARYLTGTDDAGAIADIEKAASLDPNDPLFTESLKLLRP